jgi:IS30 family transposase/transposase-like protein
MESREPVERAAGKRSTVEEREEFFRVLQRVGNVKVAAAELGLLPTTGYSWIKKAGNVPDSLWKQWPADRRVYSPEDKRRFLGMMDAGSSVAAAAAALNVHVRVGYLWAGQAGVPKQSRSHPGKEEFHRLRKAGLTRAEAAEAVRAHPRTARRWENDAVGHAVGVRVNPSAPGYKKGMMTIDGPGAAGAPGPISARYLSLQEREAIYDLHRAGESMNKIAALLGRAVSTVSRELARNTVPVLGYLPHSAHRTAAGRRPRPKKSKLAIKGKLRKYVKRKLKKRWSPEQISNRLIKKFPNDPKMRVSPETIYQALYIQARGGLKREVVKALRTGRARRKPRTTGQERRPRFPDPMLMISERPPEVEDRAIPGHWEGDLITGALNKTAIATLVERTTRYVALVHLPTDHGAIAVRDGLIKTMTVLPGHLRGSLTWDQGSEMAAHRSFSMATDMDVYFCDPASPWQRGTNENTNGLLRQYFPKGTDLSVYTPEDLKKVEYELNGRPRKTLDWDTPAERLRDLLLTA